jgi:hypothetical protein
MKLGTDTVKAYGRRLDSVIDFELDKKPLNDTELLLERTPSPTETISSCKPLIIQPLI